MSESPHSIAVAVLATDLDGTLIPLAGDETNLGDLGQIESTLLKNQMSLVFVTGRHLQSVEDVIESDALPRPDWIICDVGTSIYRFDAGGGLSLVREYAEHLGEIIGTFSIERLKAELGVIDGLRLQESEKQGDFKLSYYVDANRCEALADTIQTLLKRQAAPYGIIHSVDPFNGDGLIDLLPTGVSKAKALEWWAARNAYDPRSIVFAGDSGNDFAALTAGFRSILVANASQTLIDRVKKVHASNGWEGRLHVSNQKATSGVLDGLNRYLHESTG